MMSRIAYVHWDLDGIASGVELLKHGTIDSIFIPYPGYYWIEEEWIDAMLSYNEVYILDMIPRERDLEILSDSFDKIHLYDHSPICRYIGKYPNLETICKDYPSTTYLIMKEYSLKPSFNIIIGVFNDIGDGIKSLGEWAIFKNILSKYDLDLDSLGKLCNVLNSPIYYPDLNLLYENIYLLSRELYRLDGIDSLDKRLRYINLASNLVNKIVSSTSYSGRCIYIEFKSRHYILPLLISRLIREYSSPFILIDKGYFSRYIQIAAYNREGNYIDYIVKLRSLGYSAGGDINFMGAIVDETGFNSIINEVKFISGC